MKKVIKLNNIQLQKLIKEAIQTREPGSPLFEPISRKCSMRSIESIAESIRTSVHNYFMAQYDEIVTEGYIDERDWKCRVDGIVDMTVNALTEALEIAEKQLRDEQCFEGTFIKSY